VLLIRYCTYTQTVGGNYKKMTHRPFAYRLILIIAVILIGKSLNASPQLPDYLIYRGDTLAVYNLILEKYFDKTNQNDQGDLFGLKFRDGASLNCWRGYQAIYIIENDSLFLNNIIYCGERFNKSPIDIVESDKRINEIFKEKVKNSRVFIDWFSGNISLPNGKLLRWDGVFYKSFENEILISINKGIITKQRQIENYIDYPDRLNRRYGDTISNVLFERLKDLDWKKLDDCDCAESYIVTINKNGRVGKIKMTNYQTKQDIKDCWERSEYRFCINSIRRALKPLKFDLIKQNGIKVPENVFIEIWYEESTGQLENWTN
jgi:hypothetical protein